ncbi:MAG: DUF6056 family protein [Clostridia bacterium]
MEIKMSEGVRKKCFIAILSAVFLLMVALNALTPPVADDYMYAYSFATGERLTSVTEIIPSLIQHGQVMNGRYVPHFVVQLFCLLPLFAFDLCNALVYVAFIVGLYLLARPDRRYDCGLLLAIQSAIFLLPPAFGQDMLWLAGSANYLWAATLLVYLLIPFANAVFRGKDRPSVPGQVLLCVGALLFGNMSENFSAAGMMMMGLCILWLLIRKRGLKAWMVLVTGCVLAGWLLLVLSPADHGSISRLSGTDGRMGFYMDRFVATIDGFFEYLFGLTVVYFALLAVAYHEGADVDRLAFSVGLFLSALACNTAMLFSNYYPDRAVLGPIVLLVSACGVVSHELVRVRKPIWQAFVLSLCFAFVFNALQALPENYNRMRLAQARVEDVCAQRDAGVRDAVTFSIEGRTRYDAFDGLLELTEDPQYFANIYYAKYFGLDSVDIDRYE